MSKRTPYQQADKIQDQADRISMLEEDARRCVKRYVKAEAENKRLQRIETAALAFVEFRGHTLGSYVRTLDALKAALEANR